MIVSVCEKLRKGGKVALSSMSNDPVVHVHRSTLLRLVEWLDCGDVEAVRERLAKLLDFDQRAKLALARGEVIRRQRAALAHGDSDAVARMGELFDILSAAMAEYRG